MFKDTRYTPARNAYTGCPQTVRMDVGSRVEVGTMDNVEEDSSIPYFMSSTDHA